MTVINNTQTKAGQNSFEGSTQHERAIQASTELRTDRIASDISTTALGLSDVTDPIEIVISFLDIKSAANVAAVNCVFYQNFKHDCETRKEEFIEARFAWTANYEIDDHARYEELVRIAMDYVDLDKPEKAISPFTRLYPPHPQKPEIIKAIIKGLIKNNKINMAFDFALHKIPHTNVEGYIYKDIACYNLVETLLEHGYLGLAVTAFQAMPLLDLSFDINEWTIGAYKMLVNAYIDKEDVQTARDLVSNLDKGIKKYDTQESYRQAFNEVLEQRDMI